jgi:hypothetical protein
MPAARPSQATVKNTLDAIKAAGYHPTAVCVGADGSFKVDVVGYANGLPTGKLPNSGEPLSWDEA